MKQGAYEVFDGVMLGDGGLYHTGINAQFSLSLSAKLDQGLCSSMLEYLRCIKDTFELLGVEFCTGHPIAYCMMNKSRHYWRPTLKSRVHPLLQSQYVRWYAAGRTKRVPEDVLVTPLSLAHWFMGDGCSGQDKRCVTIDVSLQAHRFRESDLAVLENKLHGLGLHTGRRRNNKVSTGAGIAITIFQDSVNEFMSMVDAYVIEPYRYKLKYRRQPFSSVRGPRKY